MSSDYYEVQLFHPAAYAAAGGASAACLAAALAAAFSGALLWGAIFAAAVLACMVLVALFGRLVVTVDGDHLKVHSGWLRLMRRAFALSDIAAARVCVFDPSTGGWGTKNGLGSPRCYTARSRRGVEITTPHGRFVIGSLRPADLKRALVGAESETEDRPEYLRESVAAYTGRRRISAGQSHWGLL